MECQLEGEFKQCCCNCVNHRPVHHHCTTTKGEELESLRTQIGRKCVCGVQKGWSCAPPEHEGIIYDNWDEHSVGCEMYTTKEDVERRRNK